MSWGNIVENRARNTRMRRLTDKQTWRTSVAMFSPSRSQSSHSTSHCEAHGQRKPARLTRTRPVAAAAATGTYVAAAALLLEVRHNISTFPRRLLGNGRSEAHHGVHRVPIAAQSARRKNIQTARRCAQRHRSQRPRRSPHARISILEAKDVAQHRRESHVAQLRSVWRSTVELEVLKHGVVL
jgi:hypothetical protein